MYKGACNFFYTPSPCQTNWLFTPMEVSLHFIFCNLVWKLHCWNTSMLHRKAPATASYLFLKMPLIACLPLWHCFKMEEWVTATQWLLGPEKSGKRQHWEDICFFPDEWMSGMWLYHTRTAFWREYFLNVLKILLAHTGPKQLFPEMHLVKVKTLYLIALSSLNDVRHWRRELLFFWFY